MVEDTKKNGSDSTRSAGAGAKIGRLFGVRKARKAEQEPAEPKVGNQASKASEKRTPTVDVSEKPRGAGVTAAADVPRQQPEKTRHSARATTTSLLFKAPDLPASVVRSRDADGGDDGDNTSTVKRRARRRPGERSHSDDPENTVVKVRAPREPKTVNEPQRVNGSTRLEAKKQRRRDGRDAGRRRTVITEAEFLARRESVDRSMVVRSKDNRIQIGVLEDSVLVETTLPRIARYL
jgi:ribonuclease E